MAHLDFVDQFGNISVEKITPEQISQMDETHQKSLLVLIDAVNAKTAAGERVAVARKRFNDAVEDEAVKAQAFEDSNAVIPFTVAAFEAKLGRPLNAAEMKFAREQHATQCRELLASRERVAASAAYTPQT